MSDYNSVPPFTVCDQDLSDLDLELSLEIYFKEVKALFYEITRLCLAYIVLLCTICSTLQTFSLRQTDDEHIKSIYITNQHRHR